MNWIKRLTKAYKKVFLSVLFQQYCNFQLSSVKIITLEAMYP